MTNTVAELTALSRRDKIRDKIFIAMQPVVEMIHTTRQLGLYNIKNNKQHKLYYCHCHSLKTYTHAHTHTQ